MYEYQIHQQGAASGSTFNPRYRANEKLPAMAECAQQGGIVSGLPIQAAPLQEFVQMLDARLTGLQNTLYLLSDRLVPVMYPASPEPATQSGSKDPGAPLLTAIDMATQRLVQMQQQVENLLGRLVV